MSAELVKCSKCHVYKEATLREFSPRKAKVNGLTSWCRDCLNRHGRTRKKIYVQSPQRAELYNNAARGVKRCGTCGNIKPLTTEYFQARPEVRTKFASQCRQCNRAIARQRQRNRRVSLTERGRVLAEKRRYQYSDRGKETKRRQSRVHNHKRRERHLRLEWKWTLADWLQCKKAWQNKCAYCGETSENLTQDHFIPLADPACPGTSKGNIVPACMKCNCSKQDKSPFKWIKDTVVLNRIASYLSALS